MLASEFRILLVDDNADIHDDYFKALDSVVDEDGSSIRDLETELFGAQALPPEQPNPCNYRISSAFQGEDGYAMAMQAYMDQKPFALAFVDVRMPPGIDGIQTTRRLLADEPDLEIVLCSAFCDYPWERIKEIIGHSDRVLFLRKPFDVIEVKQMADALTRKWAMKREFQALKNQLIASKEEAVAASFEKSAFLANMSHEIRTPLNGVTGMAMLLAQTRLNEEQQEYVAAIRYSADVLLGLIDNILEFSKIEAGKLTLQEVRFDLHIVVREIQALFAHSFTSRVLGLEILIEDNVPRFVSGDPLRFRQILINLVANGLKFTEEGGVTVSVSCQTLDDNEVLVRVAVRDTGIGISPEGQKCLFQTFSQAENTTVRQHGSSGLGLVISQRLAELLGGTMGFESQLGTGSTFWYTARFRPGAPPPLDLDADPALRGVRVLICVQELALRDYLANILRTWFCKYSFAATPGDAIAILQEAAPQDPYDIFICEWERSDLHRHEILRESLAHLKVFQRIACISLEQDRLPRLGLMPNETVLELPIVPALLHHCMRDAIKSQNHDLVHHPHRVLVVEDNKINQKVVVHILQKAGYQTLVADDGETAIDLFCHNPVDLIVMDCQLPGLDGYNATRRIRASEPIGRRVPILALTANAMTGDRNRCLEAGMDDYITKPLRPSQFLPLIRRLLDRHRD